MTRAHRSFMAILAGLFLLALPATAQLATDGRRAEAELISERASVAPGETVFVALKMTMDPGWHIYWRNAGDAGLPPQLVLKEGTNLPEGALGEMMWPLPKLLPVVDGEIMDYGYDDEAVFPMPLSIPEGASGQVRIDAVADYLICEAVCIPETQDVSLVVNVGEPLEDVRAGDLISAWIAKVPGPFAGEAHISDAAAPWTLSLAPDAGFPEGAAIRFFPFEHEISHPADQPQRVGPKGASLSLTPDRAGKVGDALEGVIRVDGPGAEPVGYQIRALRGEVLAGTADTSLQAPVSEDVALGWQGLLSLVGLAFIGGLILNLMPCVLPVLSMKAIGMVSAAASGHAGELKSHGLWYTGGVLVSFGALALVILALRTPTETLTKWPEFLRRFCSRLAGRSGRRWRRRWRWDWWAGCSTACWSAWSASCPSWPRLRR